MPPKVYLPLPEYDGDFRAMPVYFPPTDTAASSAGIKWINSHPNNPTRHGLPSVIGVFILSDPETARPLAIMDATELTAARTGAAAAVATKHLQPPGAKTLALIGCGAQAHSVLAAHLAVMQPAEILLFDRDLHAAERFAAAHTGLPCHPTELARALRADVICTMTPSRKGFVALESLDGPTHINAMGADAPGKQELAVDVLRRARIFLDDKVQAVESGEVNVGLESGEITRSDIAGTLGEVVAGMIDGRSGADITVFDSTGLAVQDLAVANVVYEKARAAGIGSDIDLIGP